MEIVTVIPTNVVGPYYSNYYKNFAWMLKQYMSGGHKFLPYYRVGLCTVEDMCQAFHKSLFNKEIVGKRVIIRS